MTRTMFGGIRNAAVAVVPRRQAATVQRPRAYASGSGLGIFSSTLSGSAGAELDQYGGVSTLFSIVDLKATSLSSVDWYLERLAGPNADPDAPAARVTTHAALDILNAPNPIMSRQMFFELCETYFCLVGEAPVLVVRDARVGLPVELWPLRPDCITPIPGLDPNAPPKRPWGAPIGYMYVGPQGEKVPLGLDEVIYVRRPDPRDPYGRGIGPVQSLLATLDSVRYSAEWNRKFFSNDATPGGVIEFDHELSDPQFEQFRDRWREQHQGVRNAFRVAMLENAKYTQTGFSQKDMQFTELWNVGRDVIQEAFRIHDHMMGKSEDVNLANAQAAEYTFSKWNLVPDLERFKGALNTALVPLYGKPVTVRFCYCNPVQEDQDSKRADQTAAVTNFVALTGAGVDPVVAAEVVGLPELAMVETRELA